MVLLILALVLAAAEGQVVVKDSKINALEKQVEILTNLVYAQSNIMSQFSCKAGTSSQSNPTSECILKIANQAKEIAKLQAELKSLQSLTQSQDNNIKQLKTTVSGLSTKVKNQETKLTSLDNKYASEVSKLRSEAQSATRKINTLTNSVNQLGTKVQQVTGQWPSGSYCILASGACPAGFTRSSGYMRAISLYSGNAPYINQGTFGDSKIQCHGRCGQYGHWTGELYINACCK